jgi:hypothetical protein
MHLGMFGLTASITLNIQPTWNVPARDRLVPPDEILPNLNEWVPGHENIDLFWWPCCERLWVKSWDRSDERATARPRHNPTTPPQLIHAMTPCCSNVPWNRCAHATVRLSAVR